MPLYRYIARDFKGKMIKGEIYGDSPQLALTELKANKLQPVTLDEKRILFKGTTEIRFRKKVRKTHIAVFARQFSSMLQAGVPIPIILDVMSRQERNSTFKETLQNIDSDIRKGNTLSAAMGKSNIFPPLLVSMVEVGESNGRLDVSLERVATTLERENKLATKIKGALIYPTILFIVSIIVSILLTVVVMPVFANMFEQLGASLPVTTVAFLNISKFMTLYWQIIMTVLAVGAVLVYQIFKEPLIRSKIDQILLKLPLVGRVMNIVLMARFCRAFSALMEAGVNVVSSLETVKNVMTNRYVKNTFDEIIKSVQEGSTISGALSKFNLFTPLVVSMLRIGEESGNLGEVLSKTAELYEEESEAQLQRITAMAEPMVTILLALGIGFIVISIVQPLFKLYNLF